ncbi:MAG: fused MFS/spermidine synthase [Chloroflexi bacterium]|nr:fused MFS/spermidine synthase [Chloroflexota bacterium]
MRLRERLWNPCALVFVSNACVMIIELVASRLIAPRVGVSLYTWTSVIGVILAGASIGNYIGGRLADKHASTKLLGIILTLAAFSTLLILWLNNDAHTWKLPFQAPFMVWVVAYIAAVFMLPSIILGCISPIIVKLSITDLQRTGRTVGRIYAWSSIGSIVGTFATGFWLISALGTKATVMAVAGVLLLLGLWFLTDAPWRKALPRAVVVLVIFGGGLYLLNRKGFLCSDCLRETNYFCINVSEKEMDGRTIRQLTLDRLVHSYTDIDDPAQLQYGYEQTYAAVIAPIIAAKPQLQSLFIGGGAFTFPRFLQATVPESYSVVSEIDPEVTEVAYEYFALPQDPRIVTYNMDARQYMVEHAESDAFDIVFGDAFNDFSVPYHLTTLEFARLVDDSLRDDGVYVVNIIDGGQRGQFLRAFVTTMRAVWEHVAVIPSISSWRDAVRSTFVIVSSHQPPDLSGVPASMTVLSQAEIDGYLAEKPTGVLTDDYVPVDNYLAGVFSDSAEDFSLDASWSQVITERATVLGGGAGVLVVAAIIGQVLRKRAARRHAGAQEPDDSAN